MATISDVKIVNMALSHIGASDQIQVIGEQSAGGQAAKLWYDVSREQALEAHDWNFASKRLTLATHADAAVSPWSFRYQYPADAVAIREICNPAGPSADAVPFKIELDDAGTVKTILTNQDNAVARYTFNLTTTTLFSLFFVEALSYLLAHHMAYSITGKLSLRQQMLATFNEYMLLAPQQSANEQVKEPKREAPWIRARGHTPNGSEVT
jgi:hypothetical protein